MRTPNGGGGGGDDNDDAVAEFLGGANTEDGTEHSLFTGDDDDDRDRGRSRRPATEDDALERTDPTTPSRPDGDEQLGGGATNPTTPSRPRSREREGDETGLPEPPEPPATENDALERANPTTPSRPRSGEREADTPPTPPTERTVDTGSETNPTTPSQPRSGERMGDETGLPEPPDSQQTGESTDAAHSDPTQAELTESGFRLSGGGSGGGGGRGGDVVSRVLGAPAAARRAEDEFVQSVRAETGLPSERELASDLRERTGLPSERELSEDVNEELESATGTNLRRAFERSRDEGRRRVLREVSDGVEYARSNPLEAAGAGVLVASALAEPTPAGEALLIGGGGAAAIGADVNRRAGELPVSENNPRDQEEIPAPTDPFDRGSDIEAPESPVRQEPEVPVSENPGREEAELQPPRNDDLAPGVLRTSQLVGQQQGRRRQREQRRDSMLTGGDTRGADREELEDILSGPGESVTLGETDATGDRSVNERTQEPSRFQRREFPTGEEAVVGRGTTGSDAVEPTVRRTEPPETVSGFDAQPRSQQPLDSGGGDLPTQSELPPGIDERERGPGGVSRDEPLERTNPTTPSRPRQRQQQRNRDPTAPTFPPLQRPEDLTPNPRTPTDTTTGESSGLRDATATELNTGTAVGTAPMQEPGLVTTPLTGQTTDAGVGPASSTLPTNPEPTGTPPQFGYPSDLSTLNPQNPSGRRPSGPRPRQPRDDDLDTGLRMPDTDGFGADQNIFNTEFDTGDEILDDLGF